MSHLQRGSQLTRIFLALVLPVASFPCVGQDATLRQLQAEIDLLRREQAALKPLVAEGQSLMAEKRTLTDGMRVAQTIQETSARRMAFLFELTRLPPVVTLTKVTLDSGRWTVRGHAPDDGSIERVAQNLGIVAALGGDGWPMQVEVREVQEPDASGSRAFLLEAAEVENAGNAFVSPATGLLAAAGGSEASDVESARAERIALLRAFEETQQLAVEVDQLRDQLIHLRQIAGLAGLPENHCAIDELSANGLAGGLIIERVAFGSEERRDAWRLLPIDVDLAPMDFFELLLGLDNWTGIPRHCQISRSRTVLAPLRMSLVGVGDGQVAAQITLLSARGVPHDE